MLGRKALWFKMLMQEHPVYMTTCSERDVEEEEVQERLDFSATKKQEEDTSDREERRQVGCQ